MVETKTVVTLGSSVVFGFGLFLFAYRCYQRKKLGKRAVVKSLYVYPVKSCAGIKLDEMEIESIGPCMDR